VISRYVAGTYDSAAVPVHVLGLSCLFTALRQTVWACVEDTCKCRQTDRQTDRQIDNRTAEAGELLCS